jgi:hypothetical protein
VRFRFGRGKQKAALPEDEVGEWTISLMSTHAPVEAGAAGAGELIAGGGGERRFGEELAAAYADVDTLTERDIDIWAMRDTGYVRAADISVYRERFDVRDPVVADYEHEPSPEQKQAVIAKYEEIADYMTGQRAFGTENWTPRMAWSLGRAASAKTWGAAPEETIAPVPW